MIARTVPAIEQHGRAAVRRCQLQPPRCGLVGDLHLGDDAGKRSVPEPVLGEGQDVAILAALGVEQPIGRQTHLGETGRIEIKAGQCPQDIETGPGGEPRGDSRREQCGGRIVAQFGRARGDLVKAGATQALIGEFFVDRGKTKGEHWPTREPGTRKLGAERRQWIGPKTIGG
jgi:hypothetical protein